MTTEELAVHAQKIGSEALTSLHSLHAFRATYSKACAFLTQYDGSKSAFLTTIKDSADSLYFEEAAQVLHSVLNSYAEYLLSGLSEGISPERKAQLDVVSDLLEQANTLLDNKQVHPAAPAVLIGATLEEFLRTWIETSNLPLGNRKPSIDAYSQILREANLINKQDSKDITSWAGIRNHAAHGEWEYVESREKIALMLQGVNLFLRKYS